MAQVLHPESLGSQMPMSPHGLGKALELLLSVRCCILKPWFFKHISIYTHTSIVLILLHTYIYMYVCIYIYIHIICIYACVRMYMYICMYKYVHSNCCCLYIYICIRVYQGHCWKLLELLHYRKSPRPLSVAPPPESPVHPGVPTWASSSYPRLYLWAPRKSLGSL